MRDWEARTGERVAVVTAFAGSGTITNQIVMGVPADLALLSLELDAERSGAPRGLVFRKPRQLEVTWRPPRSSLRT